MVWYVAYGSNLATARFGCYLAGGRAEGARRSNPGARDPSPPTGDRTVELAHPLLFGGPSRTWGGGTAYLDTDRVGAAVGRAWRITHAQFEDLLAQEHGRPSGTVRIDEEQVVVGGVALDDRYGRLVPLPPIGGEHAVTFSYVTRPVPRDPDPLYVAQLRLGLHELGIDGAAAASALGLPADATATVAATSNGRRRDIGPAPRPRRRTAT